jgi:hypothetical protein
MIYKYGPKERESLREKQSRFVRMVSDLLQFAFAQNYELTFGHAFRCENCKAGKSHSLHKVRLAIDLNLFQGGVWLQKTEDHKPLGEFWEGLAPDARWGGRFQDGNHYSLEYGGRK